ncbi:MAG: FxsA family protein [Blastocatellia bacterium]|nr:FxsA family protein [Blastocatellia bacterium]
MKLVGKIFLLFTISTTVEIYLLLQLTRMTNIWVTLFLTIVSGMLGAYLVKREGLKAFHQLGSVMRFEQEPASTIIDSALVLVGAAFLITPGVITDLIGIVLMFASIRRPIGAYLQRRILGALEKKISQGGFVFTSSRFSTTPFHKDRGSVIDIEVDK